MKTSLPDYPRGRRGRYARRWGQRARSALVEKHCQRTGLERKYANKALRGQRRSGPSGAARGSRRRYRPVDLVVPKGVWLYSGQPCGKRQAGAMLRQCLAARNMRARCLIRCPAWCFKRVLPTYPVAKLLSRFFAIENSKRAEIGPDRHLPSPLGDRHRAARFRRRALSSRRGRADRHGAALQTRPDPGR